MSDVEDVTSEEFDARVLGSTGPVLVEFYADWCPDCRAMEPVVSRVAERLGDKTRVLRLNIEKNAEKAQEYGVKSIPHFVLFRDGTRLRQEAGIDSEDKLLQMLEAGR